MFIAPPPFLREGSLRLWEKGGITSPKVALLPLNRRQARSQRAGGQQCRARREPDRPKESSCSFRTHNRLPRDLQVIEGQQGEELQRRRVQRCKDPGSCLHWGWGRGPELLSQPCSLPHLPREVPRNPGWVFPRARGNRQSPYAPREPTPAPYREGRAQLETPPRSSSQIVQLLHPPTCLQSYRPPLVQTHIVVAVSQVLGCLILHVP